LCRRLGRGGARGGVAVGGGARGGGGGGARASPRHYVHAGMVRLDGEKMSKSLGNLVFVSRLLAAGTDPMAIRLAILAHHYRHDWDWTDAGLAQAGERLARWRAAVALPGTGNRAAAERVLAAIRDRLANDPAAPGALQVIDKWAADVTARQDETVAAVGSVAEAAATGTAGPGIAGTAGAGAGPAGAGSAGQLVRLAVDAILG